MDETQSAYQVLENFPQVRHFQALEENPTI